jgi:hypothetical protein
VAEDSDSIRSDPIPIATAQSPGLSDELVHHDSSSSMLSTNSLASDCVPSPPCASPVSELNSKSDVDEDNAEQHDEISDIENDNQSQSGLSDNSNPSSDIDEIPMVLPHSISESTDKYNNDLLLLALKLRHKLSAAAVGDLLKLLNYITGTECVSRTNYFFDKQFSSVTSGFVFYYLCETCGAYVQDSNSSPKLLCTNELCKCDVKKQTKKPSLCICH